MKELLFGDWKDSSPPEIAQFEYLLLQLVLLWCALLPVLRKVIQAPLIGRKNHDSSIGVRGFFSVFLLVSWSFAGQVFVLLSLSICYCRRDSPV